MTDTWKPLDKKTEVMKLPAKVDELEPELTGFRGMAAIMFIALTMVKYARKYKHYRLNTVKPIDCVPDPDNPLKSIIVPREEFHTTFSFSQKPFPEGQPWESPRTHPLKWVQWMVLGNPEVHEWFEQVVDARVEERTDPHTYKIWLQGCDPEKERRVIEAVVDLCGKTEQGVKNILARPPCIVLKRASRKRACEIAGKLREVGAQLIVTGPNRKIYRGCPDDQSG